MPVEIRRLEPDDDRTGFHSGSVELDRFFLRYAGQNQFRHHIGTTYVAVVDDRWIAGFATVTASEVAPAVLSGSTPRRGRLPQYPVPVLRLARLAIDQRAKGQGIGSQFLRFVLLLAKRMSVDYGCAAVVVDAKPGAAGFYERVGFVTLEVQAGQLGDRPEPQPMFLEIGAIPKSGPDER